MDMEFEFTVTLMFGGRSFQDIYSRLQHRNHTSEDLDVYVCNRPGEFKTYRYRELKHTAYKPDDNRSVFVSTVWDRKWTKRCVERQIPYADPTTGRIIFVTSTYKSSREEKLTEEEWASIVREDHTRTDCYRSFNKHRLAFPPESFTDLFGGHVPEFTRLTLGEYSTYGGTLEARTKCNPLYYLEIEHEHHQDVHYKIEEYMTSLVQKLFTILPYDVVTKAVRHDSAATVLRERVDNIFDEFKRHFVNYNRWRSSLWNTVKTKEDGGVTNNIKAFIMPKWDGIKATANYCDGFMFVRDSCGSLSTYMVDLPFDNDLMLQLEIVKGNGNNTKIIVITEVMAVVVKNHNSMYHVYNRNNTLKDTGRYAGNVSTSITLKTQFQNPNDVCNTYRLVEPIHSLLVMRHLSNVRWAKVSSSLSTDQMKHHNPAGVNTYMSTDRPVILITTVVGTDKPSQIKEIMHVLDRFHGYKNEKRIVPTSNREDHVNRLECLRLLSLYLPSLSLKDSFVREYCEGLLVAFVLTPKGRSSSHCYIKIKTLDTIELEYRLSLGLATTASCKHFFKVEGVPTAFPGWAERFSPVTNDRAIIECYYNRDKSHLVFLKDRPDKNKPDTDEKINAIDSEIITKCS